MSQSLAHTTFVSWKMIEEGEDGYNPPSSHPVKGRQALTQSEEEDRLAEEEGYDEEEDEDEGQLTMEEYLAKKKASDKLAQLNAKIVQRRPGEGVQLDVGPKDAGDDLEAAAASHFKEEVSFSPALTSATMNWQTVTESRKDESRTFHASCVINLPGKAPILMIHGGREYGHRLLNDAWWFHHDTQTWAKKHFTGSVPAARQAHTLTFMPGNAQSPARVYLVGGNIQSGRDGVIHVLTAREKEEGEWSWGVHHQACSLRPVLTRDTTMRELGKLITWCGCDHYLPGNPSPLLTKPHWTVMSANYPAGWAPLSSHSAVAMPNEMWIFGGKLKTNASGATWHVPLPRLLTQTKTCGVYFNQRQENVAITCPNFQRLFIGSTQYRGSPRPLPRFGHMAVFVQTKGMYVIGGSAGPEEFNDIWLLPYTGVWEQIKLTEGRLPNLVHGAATAVNHLIYIFGGFSNGKALANLFVFDTKSQVLQQLDVAGTAPSPRGGHSMSLLDDTLYIYGGSDETGHLYSDLIRLNNVAEFAARFSLIGCDLARALDKGLMTDFVIESAGGGAIKCHRVVLSARSPYFRELFAKTPDAAKETFSEPIGILDRFVRFLYRDTVRLSAAQAPDMRGLAHKTSLPQLEAICDSINNPIIIPPSRITADMKWLLVSGELSDVELVASVRSFRVHRFVLAARSPYFRAMFTSNFKEAQAGARVVMADLEPDLLYALLEFLYYESLDPQAHQLAFELLGQCELMELPDLRDRCSDILKTAISTENVALLYNAAELFKAPVLASAAYDYAYDTALKSGGLDEALIAELPEALLERVNVHRVGKCLTPLVRKAASQQGDVNLLSWINSACPKCSLPFAYNGATWTGGKLPKELLVDALGSASPSLKYEPVLSLTNQIGHRSKVTLPSGATVVPPLPRNTKRDAEQLAALAAFHVLKCGINLSTLV